MLYIDMRTIEIYINLPEDGAARPTQATEIRNGVFRVLPTPDYDPADEVWEFVPGTFVRCETRDFRGKKYLLAVEKVEDAIEK